MEKPKARGAGVAESILREIQKRLDREQEALRLSNAILARGDVPRWKRIAHEDRIRLARELIDFMTQLERSVRGLERGRR